jgi:hypothetical protein
LNTKINTKNQNDKYITLAPPFFDIETPTQRIAVIAVMDRDGKTADFWLGKKVDSAAASKVQSHGE